MFDYSLCFDCCGYVDFAKVINTNRITYFNHLYFTNYPILLVTGQFVFWDLFDLDFDIKESNFHNFNESHYQYLMRKYSKQDLTNHYLNHPNQNSLHLSSSLVYFLLNYSFDLSLETSELCQFYMYFHKTSGSVKFDLQLIDHRMSCQHVHLQL